MPSVWRRNSFAALSERIRKVGALPVCLLPVGTFPVCVLPAGTFPVALYFSALISTTSPTS